MTEIVFTNVNVFDGTGSAAFPGEVLVDGNSIKAVRPHGAALAQNASPEARIIDGAGMTLMPGLINGHCHMSFTGEAPMGEIPPEDHMALTLYHAKRALDRGFTAAVGAGAAKMRLDVVLRNEINRGRAPGPRYLAASPEITVSGGLGDDRRLHWDFAQLAVIADGPDELRKLVRVVVREGVDIVKLLISGDNLTDGHCDAETTAMTDAEVAAGAETALGRGKRLAAHARSSDSIRLCLKHGINIINHATFADERTLDLMEAKKDEIFVMPALGFIRGVAFEAAPWGIPPDVARARGFHREFETGCRVMLEMHRRGIRVLPFGDYGFPWTPQGTECRDLVLFRDDIGMPPAEILRAATLHGGQLFGSGLLLGQVKPGYLADLIVVDGDPVRDLAVLQDEARIRIVMKDGAMHKLALDPPPVARRAAA